jgi:hypothetical protein
VSFQSTLSSESLRTLSLLPPDYHGGRSSCQRAPRDATELPAGLHVAPLDAAAHTPPMPRLSLLLTIDAALKLALVALLAFGAFSGLQQFEGKAFGSRLIAYPVAVLVLPIAWRLFDRRQPLDAAPGRPYPYLADILITAPFLIDVLGNAADLYDTLAWWDDANHFFNWMLLSAGAGLLVPRAGLRWWHLAGLVIGFGATSAIVWELAEYVAFIRNSPELATAYEDTLGDLALGTSGSIVAAAIVTRWSR